MATLRVTVGTGPLRTEHDRLLRTALKRGELVPEPRDGERVDASAYSPLALRAAQRIWKLRMVNEYRSATVFSGLLPQLVEAEATVDVQTTVLRCAMDEIRHGALCGALVVALGGEPVVEADLSPRPLPEHAGCTPRERALRNLLFVGCLSETAAVATTQEEREQTRDPVVRRVIDQICADEVLHARVGWAYVREVVPQLDPDELDRTNRYLRTALAYFEEKEMEAMPLAPLPPDEGVRADGLALGVCQNHEARELFYATMNDVILPGLDAAGLAAAEAWTQRRAA
jgi:hypothetical protein